MLFALGGCTDKSPDASQPGSVGAGTSSGSASSPAGTQPAPVEFAKRETMPMPDYQKADVVNYKLASDNGLIYDPLSREAKKTGTLNKLDKAAKETKTVSGAGFNAEFKLPVKAAPYDMVPIDYKITKNGSLSYPVTVEATAFEEASRSKTDTYDLAEPGNMDIDIQYQGYVKGTIKDNARNVMKADHSDTPAAAYPNYDTSELTRSGTVKSGELIWLKFSYKNTGNTILDIEGLGSFVIEPKLSQLQGSQYIDIGGVYNEFVRELTYVYPGETREFWVNFKIDQEEGPEHYSLSEGSYQINFITYYRTENDYNADLNMWRGRIMQEATFKFEVKDTPAQTTPQPVMKKYTNGQGSRRQKSWLHYFEEFMTTFEKHNVDAGQSALEGRLWLQVAPWSEQIVLKIINPTTGAMSRIAVPITIDKNGVGVTYNPGNINTVVDDEGYSWPTIYAQSMADMRTGIEISPYPEKTTLKELLDMKTCGVNVLNTQGAPWLYDIHVYQGAGNPPGYVNFKGDSLRYMIDLSREMGFKMDSIAAYSYGRLTLAKSAKWATGQSFVIKSASKVEADYADPNIPKASAKLYLWQRERFGSNYWHDANGIYNYTVEDCRGYLRYEMEPRYAVGSLSKKAFVEWLKNKYKTVEAVNAKWGTSYKTIEEIDPEKGQNYEDTFWGNWGEMKSNQYGFGEWGPAVIDFDEFRTDLRIKSYEECVALMREEQPGASMQMRTEGSNWAVPGLDPKTDNAHYRTIIYTQLREAAIAEKLAGTDSIRSYADYPTLPLTPSEVKEVTEKSVAANLIPMVMPQFNQMRDYAINDKYGRNFTTSINLKTAQKGALVRVLTAVFPWWKATYEAGGVPGILWEDLNCDGIVTETQQKEMKFFKEKMEQELNKPDVKKQRKASKIWEQGIKTPIYSYDPAFLKKMIQQGAK